MKGNKFWAALFCGVFVAAAAAALALSKGDMAREARIYSNGALVQTVGVSRITQLYILTVDSETGYNIIEAENGRIRVSEANCPDGICVRQGWSGGSAVPIVCLPNRLIIRFENSNAPEVDAVSG